MTNLLLTVAGTLSNIFYIGIAILVLLLMITIHEFGHYIAGKKLGFKINEFAIGFGKKIYSKKQKNGEIFSLRAFPLGGYCAFEGEDEESNNPDAFNNKEPWKRMIVLAAGATFNFISAIIFAVILLTAYGYDIPEVVAVETNNTANNHIVQQIDGQWYGLQKGDVIWEVNGEKINFVNDNTLNYLLGQYAVGEEVTLTVERGGEKLDTIVELYQTPELDSEGNAVIDNQGNVVYKKIVGISIKAHPFSFFEALLRSVPFCFGMAWKILSFLGLLVVGKIGLSGVGGPIATISTIASLSQASFAGFLVLLPLIAVNLAVFNLLPFPALDGSRIVFVGIEWIRKKPVDPKIEGMIHFVGLIILLGFIIVADLFQIFT